jgi:hypothetical protein
MRKPLKLSVLIVVLAVCGWRVAEAADTVTLTGGSMSAYLGDRGGGQLTGDGFYVDGDVFGGAWPIAVSPGGVVDFTGGWSLGSWGNATVNGTPLHGDPSGPGGGRLWIVGSLQAAARPFIAPPPSEFTGGFSAPVTITGTISGYYNANNNQPPLFTVNVIGNGLVSGAYRFIDNASDGHPFYLDNFAASLSVSPLPQPWMYTDVGNVGQKGSASSTRAGGGGDVFTVRSAGANIWGTADSFGYVYQPFDGDGWIFVGRPTLENTSTFAKAGVMMRESLDPSSRHVIFDMRPNGQTEFMARWTPGGETGFIASAPMTFPSGLMLYRNGSIVSAWVPGANGPQKIGETSILMGRRIYVGVAVTSQDPTTLTTSTFDAPSVRNYAFGLPAGWMDSDIGTVGKIGLSSYDAGVFTVRGSGANIWGQADSFHFVNRVMYGPNSQIVARVTGVENTNTFAKAGIMMRLGRQPSPSDAHVVLDVRPTGDIEFMTRSSAGQITSFIAAGYQQAPVWLKLALTSQQTITGSISTDGIHWTVLGATEPDFAQMNAGDGWVTGGLVVASVDQTKLNTSTFDNVTTTLSADPTALPADWFSHDVGAAGQAGAASYEGGVFTVRGAGANIWGTADSFRHLYQAVFDDSVEYQEYPVQHAQVTARVTSQTSTNPFAKAGIMIRDSEAPDSAHVVLDVRPTGDIEFMKRDSTGASTTYIGGTNQSSPVWLKLIRSNTVVTGYVSTDGVAWTLVGTATASLSNTTTQLGPVVTNQDPSALNTATFDHVEVRVPQ